MKASSIWKRDEILVAFWLRTHGLRPQLHRRPDSPFDILCGDSRIEVKSAYPRKAKGITVWGFKIHDARRPINVTKADCYILRLNKVPEFKAAIHLVIPAPIRARSLIISLRALLTKWGRYYNRVDYICTKPRKLLAHQRRKEQR